MRRARVFDRFLPDPAAVREHALACKFGDLAAHDGEVYRRVCMTEVPGLREAIEAQMGPVQMHAMGYRLNYAGESPNAAVHSDLGWGTHALVLFLTDGESGTAFWRHRTTGTERIDPGQETLLAQVRPDWNEPNAWQMIDFVAMQFGRALIYEGAFFHSRYPFEAFGSSPEDGRLIAVAFFTPEAQ